MWDARHDGQLYYNAGQDCESVPQDIESSFWLLRPKGNPDISRNFWKQPRPSHLCLSCTWTSCRAGRRGSCVRGHGGAGSCLHPGLRDGTFRRPKCEYATGVAKAHATLAHVCLPTPLGRNLGERADWRWGGVAGPKFTHVPVWTAASPRSLDMDGAPAGGLEPAGVRDEFLSRPHPRSHHPIPERF